MLVNSTSLERDTTCDPTPGSEEAVGSKDVSLAEPEAPELSLQRPPTCEQSTFSANPAAPTLPRTKGKSSSGSEAKFSRSTSAHRRIPLLPNPYRSNERPARLSSRVCKAAANVVVEGLDRRLVAERLADQRLSRQATNDSVQSLDVSVHEIKKKHFTKNEILAMRATSILDLLHKDTKDEFRKKLKDTFARGLSRNSCHALDLAGKASFGLKMQSIGVNHKELYVDSALSGGLYSSADAFIPGSGSFLEIKSAKLKAGTKNQFQIKKISHINTSWKYLVFVCRTKQPKDWLNPVEYSRCSFWVGIIDRETYMSLVTAHGLKDKALINVTVTPGTGAASNGGYCRSWLGHHIKWTKFEDIKDKNWWNETFA